MDALVSTAQGIDHDKCTGIVSRLRRVGGRRTPLAARAGRRRGRPCLGGGPAAIEDDPRTDSSGSRRPAQRSAAIVTTVGCVAMAGLGGAAAWAFRPVMLPTPTGPAPVGTTVLEWIDVDREEPATTHRADHRTVVVQIWYPSTRHEPTRAPGTWHQARVQLRPRPAR